MKTGLGLYKKYRTFIAHVNLLRFYLKKHFVGFDSANIIISRVDKVSLMLILKKNGATIGDKSDIEVGTIFHNCKNYKNLEVGKNCHIGKNCFIDLRDKIKIEDNVVISMRANLITHIDIGKSMLGQLYQQKQEGIQIKRDSYVGVGATILMGVTIGERSIIAAGSVVNKDVESNTIVGGVPAKKIKEIII